MKNLLVLGMFLILLEKTAFSIPPPEIIEKANLKAEVIVIGKVERVLEGKKSYFELKIFRVIKGCGIVKEKEKIKVFFEREITKKKKIVAYKMGGVEVKVKKGDFVICYLDTSENGFKPKLEGLSVIKISCK